MFCAWHGRECPERSRGCPSPLKTRQPSGGKPPFPTFGPWTVAFAFEAQTEVRRYFDVF